MQATLPQAQSLWDSVDISGVNGSREEEGCEKRGRQGHGVGGTCWVGPPALTALHKLWGVRASWGWSASREHASVGASNSNCKLQVN